MASRFGAAMDRPDAADKAAARDPAAWRQQVAAELEQLIAAPPRAASETPASEFPDLRRPAAPTSPVRRKSRRSNAGAGALVLALAAGVAGIVVGAALPDGFRLQDLRSLRDLSPVARRPPLILAEARVEPLSTPPQVVRTAPVAVTPVATPTVQPATPGAADAALKSAVAPARPPRQRAPGFGDGGATDQLSDEDVILEAAYREAAQAGVPQALIRANRAEWRVVRAGARQQSTNALLDAYEARIEEVHTMADEAWRAQEVASQDGGGPGRP